MSNAKIRVFVVAGGQSRRMPGVDKTRLKVAGEPLISRALAMGLFLSSRVEVVADRWDRFLDLGIYAHEDDGERGPVDAWRRVLKEVGPEEVALVLPVDLRTFSVEWAHRLIRVVQETGRPAAFISASHGLEPYPCVIPGGLEVGLNDVVSLRDALGVLGVVRTTRPEDFPEYPSLNHLEDIENLTV